jgi:hypothetical protein
MAVGGMCALNLRDCDKPMLIVAASMASICRYIFYFLVASDRWPWVGIADRVEFLVACVLVLACVALLLVNWPVRRATLL